MTAWSQGETTSPWLQPGYGFHLVSHRDNGTWSQMLEPRASGMALMVCAVPAAYDQYSSRSFFYRQPTDFPMLLPAIVDWHSHHVGTPVKGWVDISDEVFGPPVHVDPHAGFFLDDIPPGLVKSHDGMRYRNLSRLGADESDPSDPYGWYESEPSDYTVPEKWCFLGVPWQLVPISDQAAHDITQWALESSDSLEMHSLAYSDNAIGHKIGECYCRSGCCDNQSLVSLVDDEWTRCHCDPEDTMYDEDHDCACGWRIGFDTCSCGSDDILIQHRKEGLFIAFGTGMLTAQDFLPQQYWTLWEYAVNQYVEGWQAVYETAISHTDKEIVSCCTSSLRQGSPFLASCSPAELHQAQCLTSANSALSQQYSVAS